MEVIDYLFGLRAHLSNSKNWTQGCLARDKENISIPFNSPKACSWCLIGAQKKLWAFLDFSHKERDSVDVKVIDLLLATNECRENGINSLTVANDKISHLEILSWIDRAIYLAQI